jgi:hypothetical protein
MKRITRTLQKPFLLVSWRERSLMPRATKELELQYPRLVRVFRVIRDVQLFGLSRVPGAKEAA